MVWPALAGLVSSAGQAGGGATPAMQPDNLRNTINVAPVGVNLGAIMQPYTGNPESGGFGLSTDRLNFSGLNTVAAPAPWQADSLNKAKASVAAASKSNAVPLAIGGAILAVVAALAFGSR